MVQAVDARPGQRILDVATGTGMVAFALAARGAHVVGLDQSQDMLGTARAKLARAPDDLRDRVEFVQGQAEELPFGDGQFDALTFTYLLRYVDDVAATMAELARVVKPGGRLGMVEFGVPSDALLRVLWRVHTRVGLPLMGRFVSAAWVEVGRFLGPNIEDFHAREPDLEACWRRAGIGRVQTRRMSFGAGVVMSGARGPTA
jgi:demethylmenaquinone methyltransferase/2-methoxy-6-polyprenyl-1,4-benzoquinol methylase